LPFLRFSRDKRGYETTSLVHATRRHGKAWQQVLYFFRTPPGVKVGRPALDEEAIRWIEEHNPDIEFDWPAILRAQPPAAVPEEPRGGRGKRERERERPRPARQAPRLEPADVPAPSPPVVLEPEALSAEMEALEPEAVENLVEPPVVVEPLPVESIESSELVKLRARYAEISARINERGGDPERVAALRSLAEALNPDTWVTPEEVRKGQEEFEGRIRDLRSSLGLRRRRRSRRGGRRRRRPEQQAGAPTSVEPASSNDEEEPLEPDNGQGEGEESE
jgi:hypothetical protein